MRAVSPRSARAKYISRDKGVSSVESLQVMKEACLGAMNMRIRSVRGGVLLDGAVVLVFLALTAFALDRVGVTLPVLLQGIRHFLGR